VAARVTQYFHLHVICAQARGQIAAPLRGAAYFDFTHAFIEELVPTFPGDHQML
jgi:hypothetical protein